MTETRILIVDDSELIRSLLQRLLSAEPSFKVIGTAADPYDAREKIKRLDPDVITLDIEMPRMDGLAFLEKIMALRPTPVVMVSTLTQRGAAQAVRALELGAVDCVGKPAGDAAEWATVATELIAKIRIAAVANVRRCAQQVSAEVALQRPLTVLRPAGRSLVAIGASTGGVEALREIFLRLPSEMPPMVIAQHMPAPFTASFAARLDSISPLTVREARPGDVLEAGHAYVAPGGRQLRVFDKGGRYLAQVTDDPPVTGHKPSVDALFGSVAMAAGRNAVGVILTGMGQDGAAGLLRMRQAGARTLGQSRESCIVYGMPRAAYELGGVEEEHAIGELARAIVQRCGEGGAS